MTERSVNESLIKVLRRELPRCVIIKHADRFTVGVPDMSVSWNNATTWLELKLLRKNETVLDQIDHPQLVMCARLFEATSRCWIVAYHLKTKQTIIYRPAVLLKSSPELFEIDGRVTFPRFDHHEVVDLIRQTHAR